MTNTELEKYFEFDQFDLTTNRNGSLSEKQKMKLKKADQKSRSRFRLIGFVLAVVALLLLMFIIYKAISQPQYWIHMIWSLLVGLVAFILIKAGFRSYTYTLKQVTGTVKIKEWRDQHDQSTTYYEMKINGKGFGIGEQLAEAIGEGQDTYTVYYYWHADMVDTDLTDACIMSMEKNS